MNVSAPSEVFGVITPNNDADLNAPTRAVIVNVAGDLRVVTFNDVEVTIPVPVGVIPIRVKKVFATNTTAGGLVALW